MTPINFRRIEPTVESSILVEGTAVRCLLESYKGHRYQSHGQLKKRVHDDRHGVCRHGSGHGYNGVPSRMQRDSKIRVHVPQLVQILGIGTSRGMLDLERLL